MKRRHIILLFAALAGGFGTAGHMQLKESRQALAQLRQGVEAQRGEKAAVEKRVAALREANRDMKIAVDFQAGQVREVLASQPPQSPVWADPPAEWPAWEPQSPFIWVPKDVVNQLSMELFSNGGELLPAFAHTVALKPEQVQGVNREVKAIVAEYSRLERAHTYVTNSHLAGINTEAAPAITIRVDEFGPEAEQLKQRFDWALRSNLGDQRAEMAMKLGSGWIAERLSNFGTQPRTVSAQRKPGGYYYIAVQSAGGWISMGRKSLDDFLPPHLLEFFEPLMAQETKQ